MSTTTLTYPRVIRVRRPLKVGLIVILIAISVVLITSAILVIASSQTRDSYQGDLIPVVQNSVRPISVPMPPTADIRPVPSETPVPGYMVADKPSVVPIAVPTPPSS